ncbi:MAG: AraC family transcriptional regulator [Acidobacteriota bacterium]|nr:AraC family transcriptional regulator [Acidobacteriota bacterium]
MNKLFRVSGRHLAKLEDLGIPPTAVLRRAGLPAELAGQPRLMLCTNDLFKLWKAMGELAPDPNVGLLMGGEMRMEYQSPTALAALSSENFGEAVQRMARYKLLTCPEEILSQVDGNEWSIQFRWLLAGEVEPQPLNDCCFAWVLAVARLGTGTRLSPLRVEYRQPRGELQSLERYFGCPVETAGTRNAIVFRATDAARPFVTRNAELLGTLAPQLEAELKAQPREEESFSERVRRTVQEKLTGRRPAIEEVARTLHISSRTLQRKLQEAGSSYQRVLEESRHQLARHYLNNSALELSEAAYLLGYEDASSFVRAFRTWEGVPPARWREQQRSLATIAG